MAGLVAFGYRVRSVFQLNVLKSACDLSVMMLMLRKFLSVLSRHEAQWPEYQSITFRD
ncbi:MAG: hypothetical protein WCA39_00920 [Nitrososphaeraceae archaeon]